ncbi:MAG: hypothetical protein ACI9O4_000164 [Chitinophagales bacterium]|jgi:hypothetical protein
MIFRHISVLLLLVLTQAFAYGQTGVIEGVIIDNLGSPAAFVNVVSMEFNKGALTDAKGFYSLEIPANKKITISIQGLNYEELSFLVKLVEGEVLNRTINVRIKEINITVIGEQHKDRKEVSTGVIETKDVAVLPNVGGGVETFLVTQLGVQKNNELSSSYSVRGGNFDENLVYVNDFEVYRPFLIRSGQQEGLSFVNPDMTDKLTFSSGGFQAKYGDKMASVLAVAYRRPEEFGGSVEASLLGANVHLEGTNKSKQFTYSTGFRYKNSRIILGSQDIKGQYLPSFIDLQGFFTYQVNERIHFEYLVNYARNRFSFIPEDRTTDFGLVNFQSRFTVFYEGEEDDQYQSLMNGLSMVHQVNDHLKLKYLTGVYIMSENEKFDIIGDYFLGEVETDPGNESLGEVKQELGSGTFHDWARNVLDTKIFQSAFKGEYVKKKHDLKFGFTYKKEIIDDKLSEWERRDSSGYSLPYSGTSVEIYDVLKPEPFTLSSNRYSGYIQDTWKLGDSARVSLNYGVRFQYWDVNKEWVFSPRTQLSFRPKTKKDFIITAAAGLYMQPPFYREMRNLDGEINLNLKAQKSTHLVLGFNYAFKAWDRPFKFVSEAYYKYMWDGVPYEFDNVLIRYFGKNNSKGYVAGLDLRLNGELAKGAESWVSVSIMSGQEDVRDDFYTEYDVRKEKVDANGQVISQSLDTLSSSSVFPGFIPRPTDQRVSFAVFFQDYIPKFPYLKVHMGLMFASGLPFGPPDNQRFRDTFRIPSYKRFDIGFSALLFDLEKKKEKGKVPKKFFGGMKQIWLSLEVFNLFGINNTVSYVWINGLDPRTGTFGQYAVPNYLSQRRVNLKFKVDF